MPPTEDSDRALILRSGQRGTQKCISSDANLCLSLSFDCFFPISTQSEPSSHLPHDQACARQWPCSGLPAAVLAPDKGHIHAAPWSSSPPDEGHARPIPIPAPRACPRSSSPRGEGHARLVPIRCARACPRPSSPTRARPRRLWQSRLLAHTSRPRRSVPWRLRLPTPTSIASPAVVPLPYGGGPCQLPRRCSLSSVLLDTSVGMRRK
jgi:hypothetical protein